MLWQPLAGSLNAGDSMMWRRGFFAEPLAELGREEPEVFLDKTNELFASFSFNCVVWPVLDASAAFAGGDPAKVLMVRDNLFGESVHIFPLWKSLDLYDPQMDVRAKLRMMAELPDRGWALEGDCRASASLVGSHSHGPHSARLPGGCLAQGRERG